MSFGRGLAVAALAVVVAGGVTAAQLNRLPYGERPSVTRVLWLSHPDAVRDDAMHAIGLAAAQRSAVPAGARSAMRRLAHLAPLWSEPFLVEATSAVMAGDARRSERLFVEAAHRDPRSVLAHFSLADRYLRTNRLASGLTEMAIIDNLIPGAAPTLAKSVAAFAREPENDRLLEQYFKVSPAQAPTVLSELATDPAQAEHVLSLSRSLPPGTDPQWQNVLVNTLITDRRYGAAQAAWRRLNRVMPYAGLFNPTFRTLPAPRPFNWSPIEGSAVLAEPAAGGGLSLTYYGREPTLVTKQISILMPGRYALSLRIMAGSAGRGSNGQDATLTWQVKCAENDAVLASLPLASGKSGIASTTFTVPPGCPAQSISLLGVPATFGEAISLTISELSLKRVPGA